MLEGTLETFSLTAVVRMIDDSAATGRLAVQAALGTGTLVFDGGRLVDATPAPGGDSIEAALTLFDHRSGRFSFRPESVTERTTDLDVKSLLDLVEERREAWQRIRELVPADVPLAVLPERRIDGMVTVSAHAWRVAVLAGGRTPAGLASACGVSEFAVSNILVELLEQGLIVSLAHHAPETNQSGRVARVHQASRTVEAEAEADSGTVSSDDRLYPPEGDELVDPTDLLRELGESEAPTPPSRKRR